jgi:hypothetical protein
MVPALESSHFAIHAFQVFRHSWMATFQKILWCGLHQKRKAAALEETMMVVPWLMVVPVGFVEIAAVNFIRELQLCLIKSGPPHNDTGCDKHGYNLHCIEEGERTSPFLEQLWPNHSGCGT